MRKPVGKEITPSSFLPTVDYDIMKPTRSSACVVQVEFFALYNGAIKAREAVNMNTDKTCAESIASGYAPIYRDLTLDSRELFRRVFIWADLAYGL